MARVPVEGEPRFIELSIAQPGTLTRGTTLIGYGLTTDHIPLINDVDGAEPLGSTGAPHPHCYDDGNRRHSAILAPVLPSSSPEIAGS
ncbi:hypothetical protein [Corynebacterium kroppenstedtii]|uniref:hypothetical protein n=1 Tax=Corynebacterium kroppenstedtii TaxID=161879 RepID=UPI0026F21B7D|nr:hypothetical protein [Corynebacterium kroppenstedtii]MDU7287304.1 hypothetical protein [Corynebacterium kroppenstedtii]